MQQRLKSDSYTVSIILSTLVATCVLFILIFPDQIFHASLQGLELWWNIVFPAMLPYFILLHLLSSFGWIYRLGRKLDPLMQIVFRLPGSAGWAIVAGLAAGFPAGAQTISKLRSERLITQRQAEQLLSLSFATSPVIIIHVVAVGMYGDSRIGWSLLAIHWLALGIASIVYFPRRKTELNEYSMHQLKARKRRELVFSTTINEGFGKQLGDAVMTSVQTLMKIGGVMMIFAVLLKACEISLLSWMPSESSIQNSMLMPFLTSAAEVHLGSYAIYNLSSFPTVWHAVALSCLFAWGGLSAHVQLFGLFKPRDLRYVPFITFRLLHTACAALLTFVLWKPFNYMFSRVIPTTTDPSSYANDMMNESLYHLWWASWKSIFSVTALLLIIALAASVLLKPMFDKHDKS